MLHGFMNAGRLEAGCDEAGRGCLAGRVYAAAVILPEDFFHPDLDDSKKIKESKRFELRKFIQKHALSWAVAFAEPEEIDKINILNASILSMQRALDGLNPTPDFILVDGNKFKPYKNIPYECVVKGDTIYASIAAASILAKTYRDEYMAEISTEFPDYKWNKNKGYPTEYHRKIISAVGTCPYHRKTFGHEYKQLKLFPSSV